MCNTMIPGLINFIILLQNIKNIEPKSPYMYEHESTHVQIFKRNSDGLLAGRRKLDKVKRKSTIKLG